MRLLAIDFGTSNTVAALLVDGQAPRTVTFDTSPMLPSAVFVAADGQVTVGRDAQRQARLDPTRFEPNPKRRIDDGEVLLGDRVVPVVDVIAAVLRVVATEVRRQLGGAAPDEVRLTHPAQWGATRQNVLVTAARAAGLGANLVLIPEPVAAAAQFTRLPGRALPPGGTVAVYDLGGGTFDVAIVGRTPPSPSAPDADDGQFHVLAEAGLPDLGGLDFDQAILDQVGRTTSSIDPARWQQILRPADPYGRRAARALAEDVRAAKETLSRYPQTDVSLPDPFADAHLTRTEFEGLIRPNLLRSIEVLSATLRTAGITPDRLGGIFLVGGSSRIPLVAGLIQDRLHVTPVALDQPETAVALGALLVPVHRGGSRTVAMSDRPGPSTGPRPLRSDTPVAGGDPALVPPPRARPAPAPTVAATAGARGRRWPILVGGLVLLAVIGLVLVVTRPFGGNAPAAEPTATQTSDPSTNLTTSGGPASSAGGGPRVSATVTTGLGPGKVFTAGEVAFMSQNVSGLIDCSDITTDFNTAVKGTAGGVFQVSRAVRCGITPGELPDGQTKVFVYTMTVRDSAAAAAYVEAVYRNKVKDKYDAYKRDSTTQFANGPGGRVVAVYDLPDLGTSSLNPSVGATVLAWDLSGQRYVGLVVSLDLSTQSDLLDYWSQTFKPRG
ncbi:Hsp70 protein [Nakamurella panacisegetis]|uniref:Hsp70 protein n=1 Tax=Nakamurella panacisegetis TaxID=1090615 RepID=A0A1H0MBP0_9ACTN|nr:Hsp70 family protein [Nakamurella panacisegetis]SDO77824.1 Hsp70 protein [Nakamurella panacisegetis]